ncbi:hypothetical protein HPB51_017476 [Rhipicephalus microplus]|uniref:Uncharacterized protein n=1 Tax=Rhipicephalus microplus TaxID=6941 RepID=A0A9J6F4G5_RHIMP|nr:hypothetical protein HPB51_017476 [Rhipicephalus microplus]
MNHASLAQVQRRRPNKGSDLPGVAALRRNKQGTKGGSMSSRLLACWLALAVALTLLLSEAQGAKGRGGKRGRGRMRSSGSARYIFYTHPKRKEYYDNPNVSGVSEDVTLLPFPEVDMAYGSRTNLSDIDGAITNPIPPVQETSRVTTS